MKDRGLQFLHKLTGKGRNVIISDHRRFIFIHIHKTAGDSITEALKPSLGRSDFIVRTDLQAWLRRYRVGSNDAEFGGLKKHTPALTVKEQLSEDKWENYFKFAFVRNPIGRVLSLYHYAARKAEERQRILPRNAWYLSRPGKKSDPLNWPSVRAFFATDSFSSFIRHPLLDYEGGMRTQSEFLCDLDGNLLVDFVGRFENLSKDFLHVQKRIDVPSAPLAWSNSSSNSMVEAKLSPEDTEFLVHKFQADYTRFNYELP